MIEVKRQQAAELKIRNALEKASRASAASKLFQVRADLQNSTHPGLDMDQLLNANISERATVNETKSSLKTATAKMEQILSQDTEAVAINGHKGMNLSAHIASVSNSSIPELDPTSDGTNVHNDGRTTPGNAPEAKTAQDPETVKVLANARVPVTTNASNTTNATVEDQPTDTSMGFFEYNGTASEGTNATVSEVDAELGE